MQHDELSAIKPKINGLPFAEWDGISTRRYYLQIGQGDEAVLGMVRDVEQNRVLGPL
jgi:hypothetical protein